MGNILKKERAHSRTFNVKPHLCTFSLNINLYDLYCESQYLILSYCLLLLYNHSLCTFRYRKKKGETHTFMDLVMCQFYSFTTFLLSLWNNSTSHCIHLMNHFTCITCWSPFSYITWLLRSLYLCSQSWTITKYDLVYWFCHVAEKGCQGGDICQKRESVCVNNKMWFCNFPYIFFGFIFFKLLWRCPSCGTTFVPVKCLLNTKHSQILVSTVRTIFSCSMHKKKEQAGRTFSFKWVLCHFVYHLWIVEWCVNCWKIFMNSYVYNSCRKCGVVLMSFNYVPSLQRMQGLQTLHSLLNTYPWVSKKFHMHSKLKIYFQICKI